MSDDEEIRRWTKPVSEGGGITSDPNDDYVESNCALNAAGGRVKALRIPAGAAKGKGYVRKLEKHVGILRGEMGKAKVRELLGEG